jgi:hypothetical protein
LFIHLRCYLWQNFILNKKVTLFDMLYLCFPNHIWKSILNTFIQVIFFMPIFIGNFFWWYWGLCFNSWITLWLFFSAYFGDGVSFFAQTIQDPNSTVLGFHNCHDRHKSPCPAFFIEMGSWKLFLPGMTWNHDFLDLRFLLAWDDKHVP